MVGDRGDDLALSVFFAERDEQVWFAAHLLEFIDHGAGQTMGLVGGPSFTRGADGEWHEDGNILSRSKRKATRHFRRPGP